MKRFLLLAVTVTLAVTQSANSAIETESRDPCRVRTEWHGNLRVDFYNTACHTLTPFYWKNGVTHSGAKSLLARFGVKPLSIITGGFNTNLPGLREPIDFVEIEGKYIVGRSDFWPIIFETKGEKPYLGIVPLVRELPRARRWAIAAGPWIKTKNSDKSKTGATEFIVQFFGNDLSGASWIEYVYKRRVNKLVFVKTGSQKAVWTQSQRRLIFDWTERRTVFINKHGDEFAIVAGRADAKSLGRLMLMLGHSQAMMMDGGSATLSSAMNPVYLAITKR